MMHNDDWSASKFFATLANGVRLAYAITGEASLPPLLLIHGLTDTSRTWSLFADFLPGYRLIMPDLRGHGASSAPQNGYSPACFAEDISMLLDQIGVDHCPVVGHSLGGMVAQVFAATCPERVDRLILIGTAADPSNEATRDVETAMEAMEEPIDPDSPFMQQWYANPGHVDESFLARLRHEAAETPLHVIRGSMQEVHATNLLGQAGNIAAPALLVWGDADPFFDAAQQKRLQAALPSARLAVMNGLGHNPFWEEPQKVAALMLDFLAQAPESTAV